MFCNRPDKQTKEEEKWADGPSWQENCKIWTFTFGASLRFFLAKGYCFPGRSDGKNEKEKKLACVLELSKLQPTTKKDMSFHFAQDALRVSGVTDGIMLSRLLISVTYSKSSLLNGCRGTGWPMWEECFKTRALMVDFQGGNPKSIWFIKQVCFDFLRKRVWDPYCLCNIYSAISLSILHFHLIKGKRILRWDTDLTRKPFWVAFGKSGDRCFLLEKWWGKKPFVKWYTCWQ